MKKCSWTYQKICKKNATHMIKNYFSAKAPTKDKNLYFCAEHAYDYDGLHPFGQNTQRIKK